MVSQRHPLYVELLALRRPKIQPASALGEACSPKRRSHSISRGRAGSNQPYCDRRDIEGAAWSASNLRSWQIPEIGSLRLACSHRGASPLPEEPDRRVQSARGVRERSRAPRPVPSHVLGPRGLHQLTGSLEALTCVSVMPRHSVTFRTCTSPVTGRTSST